MFLSSNPFLLALLYCQGNNYDDDNNNAISDSSLTCFKGTLDNKELHQLKSRRRVSACTSSQKNLLY